MRETKYPQPVANPSKLPKGKIVSNEAKTVPPAPRVTSGDRYS